MAYQNQYEVNLWQDEIERDGSGKIVHHPLNSRYYVVLGKDTASYGHLTFGGHDLDISPILDDIKVFYLEFKSDPAKNDDYELWANPLRAKVLQRLSGPEQCWYMSMFDIRNKSISDEVTRILGKPMNQAKVESETPFGYGYGFRSREFIEIPNPDLPEVVRYFWSEAAPSDPIEGYNMKAGHIDLLKKWNEMPRDDQLFREMCDQTFINFYTFPAENRYFVFVTNKLDFQELADLINLEDLQAQAKKIGEG